MSLLAFNSWPQPRPYGKLVPVELKVVFLCGPKNIWTHITGLTGGIYIFVKPKVLPVSLRDQLWKKCPERSCI